ncbi:macrophage mannose receptor 1-like [Haliotis rubra]|uniref:macrophage mannose receptor 1-like n=1 Tax=Haliotis rubra TaxID=36100 RepID=UPI001EE62502|nr:macrophage mannose receptor 1-like [Haliotis rubra]
MNNVQDDVNRKTGKAAQEWMNNVRDDVNRKTGKAAQEWMSHVRDDVNRRTGKAAQEWMSHVRDDVNRKTGNAAQEWMSNLRDDGNRRTGNAAQEWMNNLSKESSCPRDFVYNAKLKFCFKVIFERSSTYSAKKKCKRMVKGGRLVQPDTRDKLMELTKTISSKNHGTRSSFAIGSTKNRGRDYTWMDGSPMKYANWCLGSPNKGKACVTLTSQRRGSDMCMDDGCCYHRGKFICEKPIAY